MADMQDNPYSSILNLFRKDNAGRSVASWRTGVIRSLSPLSVELSGNTLSGSELQYNPQILSGGLYVGDTVVLLQSGDGQQYIILCKVVSG